MKAIPDPESCRAVPQ